MVDIVGLYAIRVGTGDNRADIEIPLVITGKEQALYDACSPYNPWESSMTFEHGVPLEVDVHGAESTIPGYIDKKTLVAFIPQFIDPVPPWHARKFIHTTIYETEYVPQPSYSADPVFSGLLRDAVDVVLFQCGCNTRWSSCAQKYEGIYIDRGTYPSITEGTIRAIERAWRARPFIRRITDVEEMLK